MSLPILFIGGYGHNGSTLVDCMLNEIPGWISVGELGNAWRLGSREGPVCACGARNDACEFWRRVVEEAFGGPARAADLDALRERVDCRHRSLVNVLGSPARSDGEVKEYLEMLDALYRAVASVSGARVVVDSTKRPTYAGLLAALPQVRLCLLHLLRDSRAAANSWSKRRMRADVPDAEVYGVSRGPLRSTLYWAGANLLTEAAGRRAAAYVRLRFEDLAGEPQAVLAQALGRMGSEMDGQLDFLRGGLFSPGPSHALCGHAVRTRRGPVRIRPDVEWHSGLGAGAGWATTMLSWPLLKRYGYRARWSS